MFWMFLASCAFADPILKGIDAGAREQLPRTQKLKLKNLFITFILLPIKRTADTASA